LYKIHAKPNISISTNTFKNKLPQRPWSVNYALFILFITALYGFIFEIIKDTFNLTILLNITIYFAVLFAIFKGSILIRNIFFIISTPVLLFFAIGSVTMLQNLTSDTDTVIRTIIFSLSIITSYVMLFMKPSQEWFLAMKGSIIKKEAHTISWNFQLTLIILSITIGIIIILLEMSFIDINELMQRDYSNERFRIAAIIAKLSISLFISSLIVLLPFGMLIGYWKKINSSVLTRLITMGVILPSMPFTSGNTIEIMGYFFIVKVVMTAFITYFSINIGTKIYTYVKEGTI